MNRCSNSRSNSKSAKDLSALHPNQPVYVQPDPKSLWKPGIVTEIPSEHKLRSYTIQTEDGSVLHHNRRFIKPSVAPQHQPEEPEATQVSNQATQVVYHSAMQPDLKDWQKKCEVCAHMNTDSCKFWILYENQHNSVEHYDLYSGWHLEYEH